MSASFYDLLKYAKTGIASPEMTAYDKMRAVAMGGSAIKTLTGVPPLSFTGNGKPLISWSLLGNTQQSGTPTPDAPIQPTFCGNLSGSDWTIPITNAGQTNTVYLGQTQTVRKIRKLVLDGTEMWYVNWRPATSTYGTLLIDSTKKIDNVLLCTHLEIKSYDQLYYTDTVGVSIVHYSSYLIAIRVPDAIASNDTEFKAWLAAQYANGTPVTIWYVPAEPETTIVNEPLCKIGDYADELHSSDTTVSIPTAKGQNTLTVDTDLQPSEMTIRYKA